VIPARAAADILGRVPGFAPRVGLVLGSGLGAVADAIDARAAIPYGELPGFVPPGVDGHAGRLVLGRLGGQPVACLQGRIHAYEGHGFEPLRTMVRTLKLAGCHTLVLTCAAASLRPEVGVGRIMAVSDHIDLVGASPLTGPNADAWGPRFPSLENAWDAGLRRLLAAAAAGEAGIDLAEGVYAAMPGPCFETPAEVRMLRILGADAVGMSMVPECVVARHCGLTVAGCAVITNLGVGLGGGPVNHAGTLNAATMAARDLGRLLVGFLERLSEGSDGRHETAL
jgi:xanthosine phosphorylase